MAVVPVTPTLMGAGTDRSREMADYPTLINSNSELLLPRETLSQGNKVETDRGSNV